jgi:hypothetical protein
MALTDENPHIFAVTLEPDPRPDAPLAYRVIVETDLDPGTPDDTEREKLAAMVGLVEMHMRAENPALTNVVLHQRPTPKS